MTIRNVEGDLEQAGPHNHEDDEANDDRMNTLDTLTIHDLQNAINTMTLQFPNDVHPIGAETEGFNSRLELIVEQNQTLFFHPSHRPSIFFRS